MNKNPLFTSTLGRLAISVAAAAMLAACASNSSNAQFAKPDDSFNGQVRVVEAAAVYPGDTVKIAGANFKPGQQVQFLYEGAPIVAEAATADAEGQFTVETRIPSQAEPGRHPVLVSVTNPSAGLVYPLKVSPNIPVQGADRFDARHEKLVPGLYQSAYSAKNNAVFVTAAVGRPPIKESQLVKVDADDLRILQRVSPLAAPDRQDREGNAQPGGLYGVYGVGVDDTNDTVWVTNTRQNTIAVYRQADLSLVKQFEPGQAGHARDVVVDSQRGKAYVSTATSPAVEVFDTRTLQKVVTIEPQSGFRGPNARPFGAMSLALDAAAAKLFVVSSTGEIAIIDTQSDRVEKLIPVVGAASSSGIAHDAANGRIFVASQGSDNLAIVDANSGETLHNVLVGAGSLNVAFDPVSQLAYVANRGSGTVTVVNGNGEIVANLDGGPQPNHVGVGRDGVVYVVNKGQGDDPDSNRITRLQPK